MQLTARKRTALTGECGTMFVLTDEQRDILKKPFGRLVADNQITRVLLQTMIGKSDLVVTVGDATTQRIEELGIFPRIEIVDGREQRTLRQLPPTSITATLECTNPPGTLYDESIDTVRRALDSKTPVRIIVDGEEDLFVLLVCDMYPDGTVVVYGQPNEGIVVVHVNPMVRDKAHGILASMERKDDDTVAE